MQSQILLANPTTSEETDLTTIGIIIPLEFPFNLFINMKNLMDPDMNLVYFLYIHLVRKKQFYGVFIIKHIKILQQMEDVNIAHDNYPNQLKHGKIIIQYMLLTV